MENKYYFLDPDNNRKIPDGNTHCHRCQKPIKDINKAMRFSYHPDCEFGNDACPNICLDPNGENLIGKDCWNKISKTPETKTTKK